MHASKEKYWTFFNKTISEMIVIIHYLTSKANFIDVQLSRSALIFVYVPYLFCVIVTFKKLSYLRRSLLCYG